MYYEVIPTKLFRQDSGILTYSSHLKLLPGHIVKIPLGKTTTIGIVSKKVPAVDFSTKEITELIYDQALPNHLLKAIFWLSEYYLVPLPTVAKMILPIGITKHRRIGKSAITSSEGHSQLLRSPLGTRERSEERSEEPREDGRDERPEELVIADFPLSDIQRTAIKQLDKIESNTKLLHGITGSGKTNIYLELAKKTLNQNKSVILLVPEIALTSQLVQIFTKTFQNKIVLIHSRQTEAERHLTWQNILQSSEPLIIIGPRSALFAPLQNLGTIIIDEAHESAYFQDNTPKYSAIRLASFIAKMLNIDCILGTATPLVTDYYLAKQKNALVELSQKALCATPPQISVIDFKDRQNFTKNRYFSNQLLEQIAQNLEKHQQTLIFHNRRGSASLTICEKCGWQALCPNCFLPLTLHADSYKLRCHTCGHEQTVPSTCPDCHHSQIIYKGFGTKLLENEIKKLFPNARVARFDGDNNKTDTLDQLYDEIKNGNIDILIGTQTLAKGLDLPKLATVGIVQADAGLSLPDYSAEERTFELLNQVIGRVGRGHIENSSVIVQTFQPESPIINFAVQNDYQSFADYLISKRQKQHFPPFLYLARISITYKTEKTTLQKIRQLRQDLTKSEHQLFISHPVPAFHEHTQQGYTWELVVRSRSRNQLLNALAQINPIYHARISLDPPSLL